MNNKILILLTVASLVTLSGCKTGGTSSSSLRPTVETVADTSVINRNNVLAMPMFKVNFKKQFDASARQESSNWSSSASVSQTVVVDIVGIDEAMLQDITNQAYQDLLMRLAKKNIKVMSIEQANQKSAALRAASASNDFPQVDDEESTYLADKTMYPTGFLDSAGGRLLSPPADIFKQLKTGVLAVDYTVDYVASKSETESVSGWNRESLSAEIGLSPAASVSGQMQLFGYPKGGCGPVYNCGGPGSIVALNKRAISTVAFGDLKNTTSTGSKVAQGAVKVLGFLMGSKSSSSLDNFTLTVDQKNFVKASVDALKKANQQLVNQF